jgi:hypothetical protein
MSQFFEFILSKNVILNRNTKASRIYLVRRYIIHTHKPVKYQNFSHQTSEQFE